MKDLTPSRVPYAVGPETDEPRSNLTLLLIAAGFLCLTIALVIVQPLLSTTATEQTALPAVTEPVAVVQPAPAALPEPTEPEEPEVARAAPTPLTPALPETAETIDLGTINANTIARPQFALFSNTFTPLDRVTSATIKQQMRQPIRLIDSGVVQRDIPTLTEDAITLLTLGGQGVDPMLRDLVAEAVFQRQSDRYIRELVNAVAAREDIHIPTTLRTTDGTWDTYSLLKGMAQIAGGPVSRSALEVDTNGTQRIVEGDSLARIALRYYGQPFKYDIILAANPQIDPVNPVLEPGALIQMPRP